MRKIIVFKKPTKTNYISQSQKPRKKVKKHSWAVLRGLLNCRDIQVLKQQKQPQPQGKHTRKEPQQKKHQEERVVPEENNNKCMTMRCSGSLCKITKVLARSAKTGALEIQRKRVPSLAGAGAGAGSGPCINAENPSRRSMKSDGVVPASSSSSSLFSASSDSTAGGSFRGMSLRRLSGCYECRMVVDPVLGFTRDACSICSCPHCGEVFTKAESSEHHQAVKHAVSELGEEDTSKNIVEIIFQSTWLKKQPPTCKIERILKIQNSQKTITKFEEYRDLIKAKAARQSKKHPRCIADGNELLRFHCATFTCSLGLNGSSNLCNMTPQRCDLCGIIRNGFKNESDGKAGILTMGTSGKAHDRAVAGALWRESDDKMALLVCRVIAGRVKKSNNVAEGGMEEYDSVAGGGGAAAAVGAYSTLEELYVFNHTAILPCFVVIYTGF